MGFLRSFLKRKKRDGREIFKQLLTQANSLGNAVMLLPSLEEHAARQGEALTEHGSHVMLMTSFLIFCEDSIKYGRAARSLLDEMGGDGVDFSGFAETEYLLFLMTINVLLTAKEFAKIIALERDQQATVYQISNDENDPRRRDLAYIVSFGELASEVQNAMFLLSVSPEAAESRERYGNFIETRVRPEIPANIARDGTMSFTRQQAR